MKGILCLAVISLLMASSCHRSSPYETLGGQDSLFSEIYALRDAHPGQALSLFAPIADTLDEPHLYQRSKFLFYEFQILKTELAYKNFQIIDTEGLVLDACLFYDSLLDHSREMRKDAFIQYQSARAHYYKAVVLEGNEMLHVEAFSDYLRSLWIMDGLTKKRRVFVSQTDNLEYEHFTGLIYDRLAWFLYNHDVWDLSLECLDNSNTSFAKEGWLEGIASNYDLMGDVMLAQDDREGAVKFYRWSDSINNILGADNLYENFNRLIHKGIALSAAGDKEAAKTTLLTALNDTLPVWMTRRAHFGLGYIYYDQAVYDSSLLHFELGYPLLPRQTAKTYARIIQLANRLGDSIKAGRYGDLLADVYFNQVRQSGHRTRMVTLVENYKAEAKEVHNRDILYFILLFVGVLAFIILIDTLYIQWRKRKHKKEIAQHERIRADLEDEISTVRDEAIRKDGKIKELEDELEKVITNPDFYKLPLEDKLATLYKMPISKRVRKVLDANVKAGVSYPELVLSDNQMNMLVNAVDAVFPKFSVKLIERYPRLKRSDVVYCCMYILGITEIQAAALTGKTYQAVWKRSLKLHNIFDNKADLQFVLHDMLRDWK